MVSWGVLGVVMGQYIKGNHKRGIIKGEAVVDNPFDG